MADQKRWFKVWTSLLVDMDAMPAADVGHWVRLGCRIALVGTRGSVVFDSWSHVATFFRVTVPRSHDLLQRLPGVVVDDNGKVTVTMLNWKRYQEDSTAAERMKRLRSKKRGEESKEANGVKGVTGVTELVTGLVLYDCLKCGQAHEGPECRQP